MMTMPIATLYAKHYLKFLTHTGIPNPLNKSRLQTNDSVTDVEATCLRLQLIKSGFELMYSRSKVPTNNLEAKLLQYFLPSKEWVMQNGKEHMGLELDTEEALNSKSDIS